MKFSSMMFHKKIVVLVKYNKVLLSAYRILGNAMISVLKLFTRVDEKKILFMSFGGQKFDDSPKALYDAMKEDPFFKDYTFVWAFTDPNRYGNIGCKSVKVDTFAFYVTALTSTLWINNSSVTRGLNLKRNGIFEINTWHGTPLKKMGKDIVNNQSYSSANKWNEDIIYCAQSEYDQEIFTRLFNTRKENIVVSDLPRNDSLLRYTEDKIKEIKRNLNIDETKRIILYAPTFREYDRNKSNACYLCPPVDLKKWKEKIGDDFVVLFRAHYEIIHVLGIQTDVFIRNVSDYSCLNDLMAIADVLISDYSSIYFDYSILERPMFNFSYDYELYCAHRGLYLDLREVLPCNVNYTEDTLLEELKNYDPAAYSEGARRFKHRFCPNAGNATNMVVGIIKAQLRSAG